MKGEEEERKGMVKEKEEKTVTAGVSGDPAHPVEEKQPMTTIPPTKGKPPSMKKPGFIVVLAGNAIFYILELFNILYKLFARPSKAESREEQLKKGSSNISSFPTETLDSSSAALVIQKPSHVSFVLTGASPAKDATLGTEDPFFVSAARLVWYAIACDVRYISLYDPHGHIKSVGKRFAEKTLMELKKSIVLLNDKYNSKDKCRISLTVVTQEKEEEDIFEFNFSSQKGLLDDKPLSQEPLITFNVRLYDLSDGREDLVNLTKEIAKDTSLSPSDITQDYISSHLRGKYIFI